MSKFLYEDGTDPDKEYWNERLVTRRCIEDEETGCINWTGPLDTPGYGAIKHLGKKYNVHRFVMLCNEDIPDGVLVRHMCHNKLCCNYYHLSLGSHQDNWNDSEEIHRAALEKTLFKVKKPIIVDGVHYESLSECCRKLNMLPSTLVKYRDDNNVFDINKYREVCLSLNRVPKI